MRESTSDLKCILELWVHHMTTAAAGLRRNEWAFSWEPFLNFDLVPALPR